MFGKAIPPTKPPPRVDNGSNLSQVVNELEKRVCTLENTLIALVEPLLDVKRAYRSVDKLVDLINADTNTRRGGEARCEMSEDKKISTQEIDAQELIKKSAATFIQSFVSTHDTCEESHEE